MLYRVYSEYYPGTTLSNSPNTYAVDSEVVKGLHYAVHKGHFVVLMGHDVLFCPLNEIDDLTSRCGDEEVKDEIKEIAKDMITYKRGEREYAKFRLKGRR